MKTVGIVLSEAHGRDRIRGVKDGRRIFRVLKEDLLKAKPPSFVYFGHYKCTVEYEGQAKTCHYCAESTHLVKDCPYKTRNQEVVNDSWEKVSGNKRSIGKVTFRQLNSAEEERPYSPSKEIFPSLPISADETNKHRHSTPKNGNKSHVKKAMENTQHEHSYYDNNDSLDEINSTKGEQLDDIDALSQENERYKRERSDDSSVTIDIPPGQKVKEDAESERSAEPDESEVFDDIVPTGVECQCGEKVLKPTANMYVFCHVCPLVYYRCDCITNNIKFVHKLRQGMCDKCNCRYVPDVLDMNATAMV
ncbi:unnamed protein product [Clavelina lepadiformis]|uniref:CCHC-type domain-containing protein n=1 Tax=Clavelina lepadiformis TaxID=159417 RepID=A0ABP0FK99_CLALP